MSGATELLVVGDGGEVRGYTPTAAAASDPAGGGVDGELPSKRKRQV